MTGVFFCVSAKEKGAYDHIIVNDDLEVAYEKLKGILIKVSGSSERLNLVEKDSQTKRGTGGDLNTHK